MVAKQSQEMEGLLCCNDFIIEFIKCTNVQKFHLYATQIIVLIYKHNPRSSLKICPLEISYEIIPL